LERSLSASQMRALALAGARVRLAELQTEIAALNRLLGGEEVATRTAGTGRQRVSRRRGQLSAAGRAAIAAAQKARWAKVKAAKSGAAPATTPSAADGTPARSRRQRPAMSAAARKAVGLRMRKYWAARRKADAKKSSAASKG
jgi:hypothetical protein